MLVIYSPASWYLLRFDMDADDIKRTAETRFLAVGQVDLQCDTRNRVLQAKWLLILINAMLICLGSQSNLILQH